MTFAYHYGADTTPPTISNVNAVPDGSDNALVTWTTNEPSDLFVQYGTTPDTLALSANSTALETSHSITLTGLSTDTTYYYRVTSKDAANNSSTSPLLGDPPASFTTPPVIYTLTDTTVADFNAGSTLACVVDGSIGDGALRLPLVMDENFSGTSLPEGWTSDSGTPWTGGTASVSGGQLVVDGAIAGTSSTYTPGRSLEFIATFTSDTNQHIGFTDLLAFNGPWAIFSTKDSTTSLYARTTGTDTLITGNYLNAQHLYRIEWTASSVMYYIDGGLVATHNTSISTPLAVIASDLTLNGSSISIDSMRLSPYVSPCTFEFTRSSMPGKRRTGAISTPRSKPRRGAPSALKRAPGIPRPPMEPGHPGSWSTAPSPARMDSTSSTVPSLSPMTPALDAGDGVGVT